MINCEYLVIGAGQTGLNTAYQLSQSGKNTILVEQAELGGAYLFSQEIPRYVLQTHANEFNICLSWYKDHSETFAVLKKKRQIISKIIRSEVERYVEVVNQKFFNQENLQVIKGKAEFTSKTLVEINSETERHLVNFDNCVICAGKNTLISPNVEGLDEIDFLHQHNIFLLETIPSKMAIIGVDEDSLLIADIYSSLGVKVIIFEEGDPSLAINKLDRTAFNYLIKKLIVKQVDFHFKTKVQKIVKTRTGVALYNHKNQEFKVSNLYIHLQESFSDQGMNLAKVGINYTPKGVLTTQNGSTQQKNIWVLGDANSKTSIQNKYSDLFSFLHQKTEFEDTNSVNLPLIANLHINTGTNPSPVRYQLSRIYTQHPVLTIGISETEALARYGKDVDIEILESGTIDGFIKIVLRKNSRQMIGVSLAGQMCTNLEVFTVSCFHKQSGYDAYRNFIKSYLGI